MRPGLARRCAEVLALTLAAGCLAAPVPAARAQPGAASAAPGVNSVVAFGDAAARAPGAAGPVSSAAVVGIAATPQRLGYWLVTSTGQVVGSGDAHFYGSTGNIHLDQPVVGIAATPDGHGYWLVASDGGIFTYGDAPYAGSAGGLALNGPIVAIAVDRFTWGYWLIGAEGGVFAYGAPYLGPLSGVALARPIVGGAAS